MKKSGWKTACRGLVAAMAAGMISAAAGGMTAEACTSYYAGKKVTADGSILFGRTEDIGGSHSKIFKVYPAAKHEAGEMYTDATSFTMPMPAETYRYTACEDDPGYGGDLFGEVGTNEYGVSMSATESASPSEAIWTQDPFLRTGITESSMLTAVLPCVKTAREGVEYLANILDTYGAGEGNTLMIADKDECWYIEILSGHQYAAIKMPEDKVAMMPNCFMIETIDVNDTENVIASKDLIATAEAAGTLVREEGNTDAQYIHVSKSYGDAMEANNANRIWGGQLIFNPSLADTIAPMQDDYDMFVEPEGKVTVQTLYKIAGTQYEGLEYPEDNAPTTVIGTYRSCECHVLQIRPDMPTELATIEWLAMGSADLSPFIPFYSAAITDTLPAYQIGDVNYQEDSAYWAFRALASLSMEASSRDVAAVNVKQYWTNYVDRLVKAQEEVDAKMMALYQQDPAAVSEKATNLGMAVADQTIKIAKQTYGELAAKIAAGNGKVKNTFTPSVLKKEIYPEYTYEMKYQAPADASAVQAEADRLKQELDAAKAELDKLKNQQVPENKETVITTNKKKYTVNKGKKVKMKVTVSNANGKKVTYKSGNKKIAKVNKKGVITGVKKGKTTITIKCNGVSKKVKVVVNAIVKCK